MINGIAAGVLWALVTVLLSLVINNDIFQQSSNTIYLAPFVCAFLNDAISGIWLLIFRKSNKKYSSSSVLKTLKQKNGRLLILSGLLGGPLGMSSYLLAIKFIGSSYTAVISSLYPAIGAIIAWVFLKDKLSSKQLVGILFCAIGIVGMVGTPKENTASMQYIVFALSCAIFWGLEAVISSYAMNGGRISFEIALQIRHTTSILCYGIIFLPLLGAWGFTMQVLASPSILLMLITALFETGSYLYYYKAIHRLGATKAMTLNILYMVWAVLLGIFLFDDLPSSYESISILVLFVGVICVVKYGRNQDEIKSL